MLSIRSLVPFLMALILGSTALLAQGPVGTEPPLTLDGSYHIVNMDGTGLGPGVTAGVDVSTTNGVMTGRVWVDMGQGPVWVPGETLTYELIGINPLLYTWTNVNGNSGMVGWNAANGRFESIVITGPNSGTMRAYNCR